MPKGGGAIRGIDHAFKANAATGTAALSLPLPFTPSRALTPDHTLSYNSGNGNSPFGLGWSVDVPEVRRGSTKFLPIYDDETDRFELAGSGELVPDLAQGADGIGRHEDGGRGYTVRRFRLRGDASVTRAEYWKGDAPGDCHWRVWSGANTVSIFGRSDDTRVTHPKLGVPFAWKLERVFDAFGNIILYRYKSENLAGLDLGAPWEAHRAEAATTVFYLHEILYGNRTPYRGALPPDDDFAFVAVFDYGEFEEALPTGRPTRDWAARPDPFSVFRMGFEQRQWRLCRRFLQFHRFDELGPERELVRALSLHHDTGQSQFSRLTAATVTGFRRENQDAAFETQTLPPMAFTYSDFAWSDTVHHVKNADSSTLKDSGEWVDLEGVGMPGILETTPRTLSFRENLGEGTLADPVVLKERPSLGSLTPTKVTGRGATELVAREIGLAGRYEIAGREAFRRFRQHDAQLRIDADNPEIRALDLSGDGLADLIWTDGEKIIWYENAGTGGYASGRALSVPMEGLRTPRFLFSEGSRSIAVGDMTGDGLADIVRIDAGSVVYWPNLGYGRFGTPVQMGTAPIIDRPDQYDPSRLRLADLDGNGLADLVYLAPGEARIWQNIGGNRWGEARRLAMPLASVKDARAARIVDLLGSGMACIVWRSGTNRGEWLYLDLSAGKKPDLLVRIENGMGGETDLSYRPSTAYWREAAKRGTPWKTRVRFPVQCLAKMVVTDHVAGHTHTTAYTYYHGYFDPAEREYCGFARVDVVDTQVTETELENRPFFQPPVLTRSWFHTGASVDHRDLADALAEEFFADPALGTLPSAVELPGAMDAETWREALRSLKGAPVRQEVYALDGTDRAGLPYSISQSRYRVEQRQEGRGWLRDGSRRPAVLQRLVAGEVAVTLDRVPEDPRVQETLTLAWNEFGQPLRSATISRGRWGLIPEGLPAEVASEQLLTRIVLTAMTYTSAADPGDAPCPLALDGTAARLNPMQAEMARHAVSGPDRPAGVYFDRDGLAGEIDAAEQTTLARMRSYFADETLERALPLGQLGGRGIQHSSRRLAFTPARLSELFGDTVTPEMLREAGYIEEAQEWWAPSGTMLYGPDPTADFFLPRGERDPLGAETTLEYDANCLLVERAANALGQESLAVNDLRSMAPRLTRNANGNWTAVLLTPLGMTGAVAHMGKVPGVDRPTGFEPCEGRSLRRPNAVFSYDLGAWIDRNAPARSTEEVFEAATEAEDGPDRSLVAHTYTSGFGATMMAKKQAAPGPAKMLDAEGRVVEIDTSLQDPPQLRWIGTGRTVLNNKGQPIRQFEPYFSVTSDFEDVPALVATGVSAFLFYDAVGRSVGALNPDQTWSKTRVSPWRNEVWDGADTCMIADLEADTELGPHFAGLPPEILAGGWLAPRAAGDMGPEVAMAAEKSAAHAGTFSESHMDSIGRPIFSVSRLDGAARIVSRSLFDIEGNLRAVLDDNTREVARFGYSLLPPRGDGEERPVLAQTSMDSGASAVFPDVLGRAVFSWDAAGRRKRNTYDLLGRLSEVHLSEDGGPEKRVALTEYGETRANAAGANLIGAPWRVWDQSGLNVTQARDFLGNATNISRRFAADYREAIDWLDDADARFALLEPTTYGAETAHDALGRVTRQVTPHHEGMVASEILPFYDLGGGLDRVEATVAGMPRRVFVEEIAYDAKGQRVRVRLGNGVETDYDYDPDTYRLTRLQSTNTAGALLQDLHYTYDAVGNIVALRDATLPDILHANQRIEPVFRYRYDALYRLIEAEGREHGGQAAAPDWNTGWTRQGGIADRQQMRSYAQHYSYDAHGNISRMRHVADGGGWTRHFGYAIDSNRLAWTSLGSSAPADRQPFAYNSRGSLTATPHLSGLDWDASERLRHVDTGGGGEAWYVYDGNGVRVRKVREHTGDGGRVGERLYFGSFEIYRERVGETVKLERETLHIGDDLGRVAIVETETESEAGRISAPDPVIRYQMGNHLGSAALELDETGAVLSYEEYHPYGTTALFVAAEGRTLPPKRYRFTGKERDEESGLSYHGARYYAPWLARWVSADPIGTGDGLNVYAYVGGRPIGSVDPTGMGAEDPEQPEEAREQAFLDELKRDHVLIQEARREDLETGTNEATKLLGQKQYAEQLQSSVEAQLSDFSHKESVRTDIQAKSHDQKISKNLGFVASSTKGDLRMLALVKAADEYHFDVATLAAIFFNEGLKNQSEGSRTNSFITTGADLFIFEAPRLREQGYLRDDFREGREYFDRGASVEKRSRSQFDRIELAVEGSTAILAERRDRLDRDLQDLGLSYGGLTDQMQVFWLYVYYNSGVANGKANLTRTFERNDGRVPVPDTNFAGAATLPFTLNANFNAQRVVGNFEYWRWALSGKRELDFENPRGPRY